jgi:hypothetical protein
VHRAPKAFGAPVADLTIDDLSNEEVVYPIGVAPNRIDVFMGVTGWGSRTPGPGG